MKDLHKRLNVFSKDVEKRVNTVKIQLAIKILWNLTQHTPVDTSKALSNWITSLGKANGKTITAYVKGTQGSTQSQSASMAHAIGSVTIQRAKVGELVYITNNLDYIELLNKGRSKQAPPHFIEREVDTAVAEISKVRL